MSAPMFELITELQATIRRDFPVDSGSEAILNPLGVGVTATTLPLVEGEWLELNSSYALVRGTGIGIPAVFPVHTEKGRYDVGAIKKVNVIFLGMYEAETQICPAAGTIAGYSVGDELMIGDVTVGGVTRRGLLKSDGTDNRVLGGFVTKVTGSKLRFVHFGNQKIAVV